MKNVLLCCALFGLVATVPTKGCVAHPPPPPPCAGPIDGPSTVELAAIDVLPAPPSEAE